MKKQLLALIAMFFTISGVWAGTLTVGTTGTYANLQSALANASSGDEIHILTAGNYSGFTYSSPGSLLVKNMSGGTVIVEGLSPALTVTSGIITFQGVTFVTPTNDPTILITGGKLIIRTCTVIESTTINQSGILLTGGELDAGLASDEGHNTFIVNGAGKAVNNTAGIANAIGNYWGGTEYNTVLGRISGTVAYDPWCNSSFTQCNFSTSGGPVTTAPTMIACTPSIAVPITVDVFNNIDAISLTLDFDPLVLNYTGFTAHASLAGNFTVNLVSPGRLKLAWYSFSSGVTILPPPPPPYQLVSLQFNYNGGTSFLNWNDSDDVWCEYSNAQIAGPFNDNPTSSYYINGWVTELPAAIAGPNISECQQIPTQTLTATAIPVAPGTTITWFDALTGGNIVPSPTLSAPGTVTYYAANSDGVCNSQTRVPVTLHMDPINDATIQYLNANNQPYFCTNGTTVNVSLTGTTGGVFSVLPSTGLALDPVTGQVDITNSVAGTYTVAYTMQAVGLCPANTVTTPFILTQLPTITTYQYDDSPFCFNGANALPNLVASHLNGIHTIPNPPFGLVFNNATGELYLGGQSLPNTYTMLYTIPAALGCPDVTKTTVLTVLPPFYASATMTPETCPSANDGTATVITSGGSGQPSQFTYLWDDPQHQTTPTAIGLGAGTYTVVVTDTDNCDATASVTVTTIPDYLPPVITCPNNITQPTNTGVCEATVTIIPATATDNCLITNVTGVRSDYPLTLTDPFPLGLTTILWTAMDLTGNSATCVQTVTIIDTEDPVITCPANVVVNADQGLCSASVSVSATAIDNCGTPSVYGIRSDAGLMTDPFPVGITTITWTAVDNFQNIDVCVSTVEVIDNQPPVMTCPQDINTGNTPGYCHAYLYVPYPNATDNCTSVSVYGVRSDALTLYDPYPIGTTTIIWTAYDMSGNSATCTQTITITDVENPSISCPNDIYTHTDQGLCSASLQLLIPLAWDNCGTPTVTGVRSDALPLGDPYPLGTTTIVWTAVDMYGNSSTCTQTINVSDIQPPVITCPADIMQTADQGLCSAVITIVPATASDNCTTIVNISGSRNDQLALTDPYPVGLTIIKWTALDNSGNSSTCLQNILVTDNEPPTITCQPNINQTADPNYCGAYLSIVNPVIGDNCGSVSVIGVRSDNLLLTDMYPVGTTLITWTAFDYSNNTSTCVQTVTITDNQPPFVSCPMDIIQGNDIGLCGAMLQIVGPFVSDNCDPYPVVTWVRSDNLLLTDMFPVGITTITWSITDFNNNTSTCVQTVTIYDSEAPAITCPANINAVFNNNDCDALVNAGWPVTQDNCGVSSVVWVRSDMEPLTAPYNAGSTTITWTVTDLYYNSQSCIQTILVAPVELIALYNFDNANQYPIPPDYIAPTLTGYATSFEPFLLTPTGTPTGPMAFVSDLNTTGNDGLAMAQSNGNNVRYFEFITSGDSLYKYRDYQIYVQGRRESQAANMITAYYSYDGLTFWPGDSMSIPVPDTWFEGILNLTGHDSINYKKNIYIRLYVKGTNYPSGLTQLSIDNVQLVGINGPIARPDYVTVQANSSVIIDVLANDYYGCAGPHPVMPIIGVDVPVNGTSTHNPNGTITYVPDPNYAGPDFFTYRICDANNRCDTAIVRIIVYTSTYNLNAKVLLQGPFDPGTGLMHDSLRVKGFIPTTEPYTAHPAFNHVGSGGGETITNAGVLAVTGQDAIVDWVFIEFRDKNNPTTVLQTRAALVQRDGDIVDIDGVSPVSVYGLSDPQVFVSIRHRNHMGVMTANSITMNIAATYLDFTNGTVPEFNYGIQYGYNYTTLAQKDLTISKRGLHAGNALQDNKVKYQGANSDRSAIISELLAYPGNILYSYNYNFAYGYLNGDLDMNGQLKYQGAGSDRTYLLNIILNYLPGTNDSFDFMIEQLP